MSIGNLKNIVAREFGTPAVVVDLDIVERNIARVQAMCDAISIANRPHIKTHKMPMIADLQRRAGAIGVTCQKLREAEVMAAAGHDNILISYNLVGEQKIGRLGRLLSTADVVVSCDNDYVATGLRRAAEIAGRDLDVLVECDTGRKRTGVTTVGELVALARHIRDTPGLKFAGVMMYPPDDSAIHSKRFLDEGITALRADGLNPSIVSSGGTPNLFKHGKLEGITEHRPGTYVFNDLMQISAGSAALSDCAVSIYSTVVSRAEACRGVIDAGSKTLTSDTGGLAAGYGRILEYEDIQIPRLMEEHGFLEISCGHGPSIGEIVRVVPNHVCVVWNMVDFVVAVRGGDVVGTLRVEARGCTS